MNILETKNIIKYFHEPTEFQVLKDISFDVKKGEFLSMIGKSGSGKSTLLYVLLNYKYYICTSEKII